MPCIIWKFSDGSARQMEMPVGASLMEAATSAGLPGIYGDCGGALSCATCHIVVQDEWAERLGDPGSMEEDMLDMLEHRYSGSRLGCQIRITDDLDGLSVLIPES